MYSYPVGYFSGRIVCCLAILQFVSSRFVYFCSFWGALWSFNLFEASRSFQISKHLRGNLLNFDFFKIARIRASACFLLAIERLDRFQIRIELIAPQKRVWMSVDFEFSSRAVSRNSSWRGWKGGFNYTLRAARIYAFQAASKFSWLSISGSRTLRISCFARFPIFPWLYAAVNSKMLMCASSSLICFLLTIEWMDSCCENLSTFGIFSAGTPFKRLKMEIKMVFLPFGYWRYKRHIFHELFSAIWRQFLRLKIC